MRAWKEEYSDKCRGPFHGIDTSLIRIKWSTITILISLNTASSISSLPNIAIRTRPVSSHLRGVVRMRAIGTSMKRLQIDRVLMHTFNNINFSMIGPIWSTSPPCGPSTAAIRHMVEVQHEEPSCVVHLAFETNGVAATTPANNIFIVHSTVNEYPINSYSSQRIKEDDTPSTYMYTLLSSRTSTYPCDHAVFTST